jgi:hypothetical protein
MARDSFLSMQLLYGLRALHLPTALEREAMAARARVEAEAVAAARVWVAQFF